jgi:ribosome maturation factor RimP
MGQADATAVRRIAQEVVQREGMDLVECVLSSSGRRTLVRVFIHREGGVTHEDCRQVSLSLGTELEVEEALGGPYVLEVSSPGLTRPLKSEADFQRSVGQRVSLAFRTDEGTRELEGTITQVRGEHILLEADGLTHFLPLSSVTSARPSINWQELLRGSSPRTPRRKGPHE